ncbi:MAG: hypothetical protein Q8O48_09010 [Anaerolineales bacterium]|nr:hypothetical protein [Anaerolineales bacterium]
MTYRHFKYEGWLYVFAFLLALALRLTQLGAMPLTDAEAAPALQALQIAQGARPALSPHPFYILSTSVLFFLYGGGTNFLARLIPALIGSLLVFAPLLFDERLTLRPRPSLLLAFFIALDPGLTALSRQAASPIFAIAFLLFTWAFINKNKPSLGGFFAALALLSGPSIWQGLLGLGLTWAIFQGFNSRRSSKSTADLETIFTDSTTTDYQSPISNLHGERPIPNPESPITKYRSSLLPFLVTFITAGTLFFIVPNGLSAALASIPAFIKAWLTPSDVSAGRLFLSLLVYQPLAFLLASIALIRGWVNRSFRIIPLSIWLLVSLLLAVFLPSRQISDLAWTLIPLCALAAMELARSFNIFPEERSEVIGVVLLTAFIWLFAWLDFSGMVWLSANSREYVMRFWLLFGALVLLVLSLLLVAAGWSIRTARLGGVWGLALVLGVLGFGGTLGSAGMRGLAHPEFWWPSAIPMQADLLQATVREISEFGLGNDFSAPVVITGIDSPALEWALREHFISVVGSLDISSAPYFVITPYQTDPVLVAAYRGQDFTWRQTPLWNATLPNDWIRWITLREMPQSGETIILWARDDLFLGQ